MKVKKILKRVVCLLLVFMLAFSSLLSVFATAYSNLIWPNSGAIKLNKTAEPTANDNEYKITLTIDGKNINRTTDIVFVFDRSGSMNDNNKLQNTKEAANTAVDSLLTENSRARIALVTFNEHVSSSEFYQYSTKSNLKSKINDIEAKDGTNIQAGIKAARELLASSTADNKIIILLGDGEPTFSYKITDGTFNNITYTSDCNGCSHNLKVSYQNFTPTAVDYNKVVGKGNSFDLGDTQYKLTYNGTGICTHNKTVSYTLEHAITTNFDATVYEAGIAKSAGIEVYSIGLSAGQNGEKTLRACATDSDHYYTAVTSTLKDKFKSISSEICYAARVTGEQGVVDPMGEYFNLVSENTISVSQGTCNYDATTETIHWYTGNIVEGTTATMTYKVTVDPTMISQMDPEQLYPSNKTTTFTYTDVNGGEQVKEFPIPEVSLTKGSILVKGYLVNDAGQPINEEGVVVEGPQYAAEVFDAYHIQSDGNDALPYGNYTVTADQYRDNKYQYVKYIMGTSFGTDLSLTVPVTKAKPTQIVYFGYKAVTNASYTVNYYKDEIVGTPLYTTNGTGKIGDQIPVDASYKVPTGYSAPGEVSGATEISIDPTENIVNVLYTKGTYDYTINYYQDSTNGKFLGKIEGSGVYGSEISVNLKKYDLKGYQKEGTIVSGNLIVSENSNANVINVVYTKDTFQYEIQYYQDSTEGTLLGKIPGSGEYGSEINVNLEQYTLTGYQKTGIIVSGNPVITDDNNANVIKVVYKKDTFNYEIQYYKDSTDGELLGTVKDSAEYGAKITVDLKKYNLKGYKKEGTIVSGNLIVTENCSANVIKVVYTKDSFDYIIKYYQDSTDGTLLGTESGKGEYGSAINVNLEQFSPTGYQKVGSIVSGEPIVSDDSNANVIKVVYKKDTFNYEIQYYQDSVDGNLIKTVSGSGEYDSAISVDLKNYDLTGYQKEGTIVSGNLIITENNDANIIKVVFTKDSFQYEIRYYQDSTEGYLIGTEYGTGEYGSSIPVEFNTYPAPVGYNPEGAVSGQMTVTEVNSNNIVNVVYTKASFDYEIRYYKDSISDTNYIDHVIGSGVYDSEIQVNKALFLQEGYKVPEAVSGQLRITEDSSKNIVYVVYEKDQFHYSINYYQDSIADMNLIQSDEADALYDSVVPVSLTNYAPVGYITPGTADKTELKITADPAQNVVNVVYSKNIFDYQVNYYKDYVGEDNLIDSENGSGYYGDPIPYDLNTAPVGYVSPGTAEGPDTISEDSANNVVNIIFVKDEFSYTVNYYKDSVSSENYLGSDNGFGEYMSTPTVDTTMFAPDGYIVPGTVSGQITITEDDTANVINVVYAKDSFDYVVRYYKDTVSDDTLIDDIKGTGEFDSEITVDASYKVPTGYTAPGSISGPARISSDESANVINVVYSKGTFQYTINYYKDAVDSDNKITSIQNTAEFDSDISVDNNYMIPDGYKGNGSVEGTLKVTAGENIINVIYEKDTYHYVVEYYKDSVNQDNYLNKIEGSQIFDSTIEVDDSAFAPDGYIVPGVIVGSPVITTGENVIYVIYERDSFDYTVSYYKDSVSEENYLNSVSGHDLFGSEITIDTSKFAPVGYTVPGVIDGDTVDGNLIISFDETKNKINVIYSKSDFDYTVEYYKDSITGSNYLGSAYGTAEFGSDVTSQVNVGAFVPTGYQPEGTISGQTVVTANKESNIIYVIYQKASYPYVINYYQDSKENLIESVQNIGLYDSLIYVDAGYRAPEGYITPGKVTGTSVVTADPALNVIDVIYSKDSFTYKVEYFKDSIDGLSLGSVSGSAEFESTIPVDKTKFVPTGYKTPGEVSGQTTITADSSRNIVYVIYSKDSFGYTINYYRDAITDGNLIKSDSDTGVYGSQVFVDDTKYVEDGYEAPGVVTGQLTITENASNNVINVVYSKANYGYTVNYYRDSISNDNLIKSETGSAPYQTDLSSSISLSAYAETGYITPGVLSGNTVISSNPQNNVMNVVYQKGTFGYKVEYYKDSVTEGSFIDSTTGTGLYGDTPLIDKTYNVPVGYINPGTLLESKPITEIEENNVYYVIYTKNSFNYVVNYYKDTIDQENYIDQVTGSGLYGDLADVDAGKFLPDGYTAPGEVTGQLSITENEAANIINVVYQKGNYNYIVNYYVDEITDANKIGTEEGNGEFGREVSVDTGKYAPVGYITPGTVTGQTVITSDSSNNIVNVLYVKDSYQYSINYYKDEINENNLIQSNTGNSVYNSVIDVDADQYLPEGYKIDGTVPEQLIITENPLNNVINIVYVKDTFDYTIKYFKDTISNENALGEVKGNGLYQSDITVDDTLFIPEGYEAPGTVTGQLTITANAENNVIYVVYDNKQTIAYEVNYWLGDSDVPAETVALSAKFGDVIDSYPEPTIDLTGYELSYVEGLPLTIQAEGSNVIDVYYKLSNYKVTTEYYINNELQDDLTETSLAPYGSVINEYIDKTPEKGVLVKVEGLGLTVSNYETLNVIKVYYKIPTVEGETDTSTAEPTTQETTTAPAQTPTQATTQPETTKRVPTVLGETDEATPQTGDSSNMVVLTVTLLAAGSMVVLTRRKKQPQR